MISIAICDDDNAIVKEIESAIIEAQPDLLKYFRVESYSSGEALCEAFEQGEYFDLLFMDIEMHEVNGIASGQMLRNKFAHDSTLLIYVSSHSQYHEQLFEVQPYQFIRKPINRQEFIRKFLSAIKKIESGNEIYQFKKGWDFVQIKKRDIISLESKGHNIILSVANREDIDFRGIFKKEIEKLTNSFFVQTHVAYIVNMNHVQEYRGDCLLMCNDKIVPISEHRSKAVKLAFLNFGGKQS